MQAAYLRLGPLTRNPANYRSFLVPASPGSRYISHSRPRATNSNPQTSGSTNATPQNSQEGWFFVDSVFPVRLGTWDLRHYIGIFREQTLLEKLDSLLSSVKTHNFRVLSLEPQTKDGGVFVHFSYDPSGSENAAASIESELRQEAENHGGMPSWTGLGRGDIWLVKGQPWREDMNRYASTLLKLSFEGPDVQEEVLYDILRPYGRIQDVSSPIPVPAGTLRSTVVTFQRIRSAAIARNVIHGFTFPFPNATTRLHANYQPPIQAHALRNWMTAHPRIVLPIVFFLLGTLTYTIFDPIRALMVEAGILDWFNYKEFSWYKWMRANTLDRLSFASSSSLEDNFSAEEAWKERQDAQSALRSYLSDLPSTVAFVHGPQGSGKSRMLEHILSETDRKALIIDCNDLSKATSDARLVAALAQQTGYRPVFTFLNSLNSMIDLVSVGLIGQKAGFSSSVNDQLKQILDVVATGLKGVNRSLRKRAQRKVKADQEADDRKAEDIRVLERIRNGTWHDGRLDCVAGNGVMCELGIGDELISGLDSEGVIGPNTITQEKPDKGEEEPVRKKGNVDDEAVAALPIVVIKNYAARGGTGREELLTVLAQWAAYLAENQIAHVIVMSDNRENSKLLARALPSKPLNSIALYDADASSSLSFVKQRLRDAGMNLELTKEEMECVGRLGGRASDLESLIHKVRSGLSVQEAVEDIIARSIGELRKNAFGEDLEDAKSLPWSREQAWIVLKLLSKRPEIPYYELLLDFPFKGDEVPLRRMDHAEIVSISTHNGRPSIIRPGRPVLKYVFERLVNDPVFQATQDISVNEKIIANAENTVRACEQELSTLKEISPVERSSLWGGKKVTSERENYLLKKMATAEVKIETLEKQNAQLKKVLSKGG